MVDAVLVATSSVFAALVVIAAIYFLVYFQHPDDKWVAWLPKLVVVRLFRTFYQGEIGPGQSFGI
jgi:LMBR1 domain-containing protein 1